MKTEVGKRYEVIANLDWISKGSVVEIVGVSDEYPCPIVKLVKGWCKISGLFSISRKRLKQIEDKPMKTTNKFPDYSFKVSTEGFNKEQLQAAYEWLKECAKSKGFDYSALQDNEELRYYFNKNIAWDAVEDDSFPELPEIKLNIETKSVVTGFTIKDNKEEKLKDIISKLEQSLEEARDELANLKTISERV